MNLSLNLPSTALAVTVFDEISSNSLVETRLPKSERSSEAFSALLRELAMQDPIYGGQRHGVRLIRKALSQKDGREYLFRLGDHDLRCVLDAVQAVRIWYYVVFQWLMDLNLVVRY
jgi:hypothetical protein